MGDWLNGFTYPFRAIALLRREPKLWGYITIPFLINLVVWIGLYFGLLIPSWRGIDALIATLPAWAAILGTLLDVLLAAGILLVTGLLLVQFGVILGAPWYGQLSEQLEKSRVGHLPLAPAAGVIGIVRDIQRAFAFELNKIGLALSIGLALLLLGLVPGIGTIPATIGGLLLSTTLVCLDFLDPPLERRHLSFKNKLGMILRSLPASASFGLICLGLISIPFLNLLTIPICITAGTLFFCDRILPRSNL